MAVGGAFTRLSRRVSIRLKSPEIGVSPGRRRLEANSQIPKSVITQNRLPVAKRGSTLPADAKLLHRVTPW